VEPEPEETTANLNGDKDYTVYADKDITPTMDAFADFLVEEVYEGELPEEFDEESFRKGVALGGSVRMDFQRSSFWAEDPRNRKNKQVEEEEEEEAPAPRRSGRAKARQAEAATPTRRSTRKGKAAPPEPEPEDEDEGEEDIEDEAELEEEEAEDEPEPEPAKPARRSRRGTAAAKAKADTDTAPAKTSGRRTSRRGGKQAEESGAAPY
jgi:hypothetical protein